MSRTGEFTIAERIGIFGPEGSNFGAETFAGARGREDETASNSLHLLAPYAPSSGISSPAAPERAPRHDGSPLAAILAYEEYDVSSRLQVSRSPGWLPLR